MAPLAAVDRGAHAPEIVRPQAGQDHVGHGGGVQQRRHGQHRAPRHRGQAQDGEDPGRPSLPATSATCSPAAPPAPRPPPGARDSAPADRGWNARRPGGTGERKRAVAAMAMTTGGPRSCSHDGRSRATAAEIASPTRDGELQVLPEVEGHRPHFQEVRMVPVVDDGDERGAGSRDERHGGDDHQPPHPPVVIRAPTTGSRRRRAGEIDHRFVGAHAQEAESPEQRRVAEPPWPRRQRHRHSATAAARTVLCSPMMKKQVGR